LSDTPRDIGERRSRSLIIRRSLLTALPLALLTAGTSPPLRARMRLTAAVVLPAPVEQHFQVFYGDMSRDLNVAEISYRLQHDADRYEVGTKAKAIGMVALFYSGQLIQKSVGRVGAEGLRPERYSEQRGKRAERVIRFDYERHKMIGTGNPPEIALVPGTQDRLSVFYQVGLMARVDPQQFEAGRRFTLPLASMKSIDKASFVVVGPEPVKTARGSVPALHLTVRNEADPEDPTIDVWLATGLSMLPARIRIEEHDGKVVDQVLLPPG
jgi:hypothetical protein